MEERRRIELGCRDGRWFTWTDDGLILWFDERSDAQRWATLWSHRVRPSDAVVVLRPEVLPNSLAF